MSEATYAGSPATTHLAGIRPGLAGSANRACKDMPKSAAITETRNVPRSEINAPTHGESTKTPYQDRRKRAQRGLFQVLKDKPARLRSGFGSSDCKVSGGVAA